MFNFLIKVFVSLLITNWIYSEICLFLPKFDTFVKNVYHTVRIPTHNEWPAIMDDGPANRLEAMIAQSFNGLAPQKANALPVVFNSRVKAAWNHGGIRGVTQMIKSTLYDVGSGLPFLRGNDIFMSPSEVQKHYYIPKIKVI